MYALKTKYSRQSRTGRNAAKSDKGSEGEPSSQQICASRQVYLPPDIMSNCSEPSCERARSASDKFKYCSACGEVCMFLSYIITLNTEDIVSIGRVLLSGMSDQALEDTQVTLR